MEFATERGLSESGKHPLLVYQSTEEPELCFKFQWKRTNQDRHMYECHGCKEAKKAGNAIVIKSIGVSLDYSQFLSDPEELNHKCAEHDFVFEYLAAGLL